MKNLRIGISHFVAVACLCAMSFFTVSCESLGELLGSLSVPSLSMNSVSIKGLDLEGITFACDYSITNPYPVAFSIKQLAADVNYEGGTFTKLSSDNGVSVASRSTKRNSLTVKIPYDSILNFAKNTNGKSSLPFTLDGSLALDMSGVELFEGDSFSIPFTKSFSVPVVKPSFSVANANVVLPSADELTRKFVSSGVNVLRAAAIASALVTGQNLTEEMLKGIDIDIDFTFDLNVANQGSAPWKFAVDDCSLKTNTGSLISVTPGTSKAITSSSGTIPMTVSLNTVQAAAFIVQLITKKGGNPTFQLSSALSFPELSYASNLPLSYSYEIPLRSVGVGK